MSEHCCYCNEDGGSPLRISQRGVDLLEFAFSVLIMPSEFCCLRQHPCVSESLRRLGKR
jgi:hypothetical protein